MLDLGNLFVNKIDKKIKMLEEKINNEKSEYKKKQLENKLLLLRKKYYPDKFYYGGGTYVKPNKK